MAERRTATPLGAALRTLRKRAGFTQDALAERAGIERSYISMLETGERTNASYETLSSLAQGLGVTTGELYRRAGLAWDAIDWQAGALTVRQQLTAQSRGQLRPPKSRTSARVVDVPPRALAALARYRDASAGAIVSSQNLIFRRPDGKPLRPASVGEQFSRWTATHFGRRLTLHELRHTVTTLMGRAGVSPRVAADAMGHSTIAITSMVYTHPNRADHRAAALALERHIFEE